METLKKTYEDMTHELCHPEATEALESVFQKKATSPLFFYGNDFRKRTTLKKAVLRRCADEGKSIQHSCATDWIRQLMHALYENEIDNFYTRYLSTDIFLLDDMEIFADKTASQEALYHILHLRHEHGWPTILMGISKDQGWEENLKALIFSGTLVKLKRVE